MNHIGRPPKREEDEEYELEEYVVEYLRPGSPACAYKGSVELLHVSHSGDEIFVKVRAHVMENAVAKLTTFAIPVCVVALSQTDGEYDSTLLVTYSLRCQFTPEEVEKLLAGDTDNWEKPIVEEIEIHKAEE